MNTYPFDIERTAPAEATSLRAWLQWQLTIFDPSDLQQSLALDALRWTLTSASCSDAHLGQVSALIHWWVGDLISHTIEHRDEVATSTSYSLIQAMRQAHSYASKTSTQPDYAAFDNERFNDHEWNEWGAD